MRAPVHGAVVRIPGTLRRFNSAAISELVQPSACNSRIGPISTCLRYARTLSEMRIPEHPDTDSNNIRTLVPVYPDTFGVGC